MEGALTSTVSRSVGGSSCIGQNVNRVKRLSSYSCRRPIFAIGLQQTSELIFAAIHAKRFDSESDIQVQVRAWNFHFDCFFYSD